MCKGKEPKNLAHERSRALNLGAYVDVGFWLGSSAEAKGKQMRINREDVETCLGSADARRHDYDDSVIVGPEEREVFR